LGEKKGTKEKRCRNERSRRSIAVAKGRLNFGGEGKGLWGEKGRRERGLKSPRRGGLVQRRLYVGKEVRHAIVRKEGLRIGGDPETIKREAQLHEVLSRRGKKSFGKSRRKFSKEGEKFKGAEKAGGENLRLLS